MKCRECGSERKPEHRHCEACGAVFTRPISRADRNRLFAIIQRAYDNWPEGERHFDNVQTFRGWLTVRAGFTSVSFYPTPDVGAGDCLRWFPSWFGMGHDACRKHMERYSESRQIEGGVEVVYPRSWSDQSMDRGEFGLLRDAITEIIELTIGVSVDELIKARVA